MSRCFYISVVVLLLAASRICAQEVQVMRSDSTAKIDGQVFIIHTVEPKQTLFSVAKAYEVRLSRIAFDNPGVLDGLQLGQHLRILQNAVGETREENQPKQNLEIEGNYVLYTVPPRQTLYAISKEYNTTIAAIMDANPELENGLKVGSTIRIPTPKIFGDGAATTQSSVQKMEMVGLPDIVRQEPMTKAKAKSAGRIPNIILMLPLFLEVNDTMAKRMLPGEEQKIYDRSEIALQFYEGFLLAADSLHRAGYKFNVKVIDTENRPWVVKQMVEKGKLNDADLIIGPLYSKVFTEVAGYAYSNCIPIVSPTIKGDNIIADNAYVFRLLPSENAMITEMGRYLSGSDSTQNLVLHYNAADEQSMLWNFRKGLESARKKPASFPSYNLATIGSDSLRLKLSPTKRNNLIFLSNNQVKLAGLIRKISGLAEDTYIVGYAPNTWQGYKNLEIDHFDDLRIHMPVPLHVDYENLATQHFVKKYRQKFHAEPSTFSFRGYDIAMHFIRNLDGIMEMGPEYMETVQETGLQSLFGWKRLRDGGFENTSAPIVDYTGFQLKLAKD